MYPLLNTVWRWEGTTPSVSRRGVLRLALRRVVLRNKAFVVWGEELG